MVEKIAVAHAHAPDLFNGPLETGLRAIVIMEASYPEAFDLTQLTWLDHLVVHTSDIGGPPSIHPNIPQRTGELLVRRKLVEEGINLMRRLHLVEAQADESGIAYRASEDATALVDSLCSPYAKTLKMCAIWLARDFLPKSDSELSNLIEEKIGRWAVEFQGEIGRLGVTS